MTGPEQYREAERLIAMARGDRLKHEILYAWHETHETQRAMIMADAPVHAILALAAATGVTSDSREWADVAGTKLSD